ncbi:MAG: glutathione peroxidase [Bacteroidetes bacterium HGW-Bacteroidetes-4]|jgi:glutathione peroxidase|nr:MAG: glutathione peroxidase [Bacteroidetes bacterium HGW-Bacteroidetes-4]
MSVLKQGITFVLLAVGLSGFAQQGSLHQFKTSTLEGEDFDLASLKGKKVLVVNTASKCGLTPQYADLEVLYKKYGGDKFVIIGFPANNFMKQEPGTHEEIREFCTRNYGVTFPMMEKISVKGDDMHPIYQWLTQKVQNGVMDSEVGWNFQKYMIDEDGQLVGFLKPRETVDSEKLISWLEE